MAAMNKTRKSALSFLVCAVIVLSSVFSQFELPFLRYASADENVIEIASAKDLKKLAKDCTLDSWSVGKTVMLTSDIELKKGEFTPIPTFGGVFDGNGYTISGVSFGKNGSKVGFIRYLQRGGTVTNLKLKGSIGPGGSKCDVGGIVGDNSGTISSCTFDGKVSGDENIGGIAGINNESGYITLCTFKGSVAANKCGGGIAGKNVGTVMNSENRANINTENEIQKTESPTVNLDASAAMDSLALKKDQTSDFEKSLTNECTDIGGIAGYSDGIIQGCKNYGTVGYKHVGYNIGGIAGRQAGFLLGCENSAKIYGRKDVGGITGQVEPYILLDGDKSTIENVKDELDKLHKMVNNLIDDTDSTTDKASVQLKAISSYASSARDNAQQVLDSTETFINDTMSRINSDVNKTIDSVNTEIAKLSNSLNSMLPVLDSAAEMSDSLSESVGHMKKAIDTVNIDDEKLSQALEKTESACKSLSNASKSLKNAVVNLSNAFSDFNDKKVRNAFDDLSKALSEFTKAYTDIGDSLTEIETILSERPDSFDKLVSNVSSVLAAIKSMKTSLDSQKQALSDINKALSTITARVDINFTQIKKASDQMSAAAGAMNNAMTSMSEAIGLIREVYDESSGQLKDAKKEMSSALSSMQNATNKLSGISKDVRDILADIADIDSVDYLKMPEKYKSSSDGLFNDLTGISGCIDNLIDVADSGRATLVSDIRKISDQFNIVMNLVTDDFSSIGGDGDNFSLSDYIVDASEEDIANQTQGKVYNCRNTGEIYADKNVGGISGSLAIEYAFDPEDDLKKPGGLSFKYKTKAIVQECINEGRVTARNDCAGGVAGYVSIGTLYGCESYCTAESSGGSYAGGIAGFSNSSVIKCYSKCRVSAAKYVGGIAGKASSISSCAAIAEAEGDEYIGAIAGCTNGTDSVNGNRFIDVGTGAIDSVSYNGHAYPVTYDELYADPSVPRALVSFYVKFIADEKTIRTDTYEYMTPTDLIKLPDIPKKDGKYAHWEEIKDPFVENDIEVEAEYYDRITAIESDSTDESGKLALAIAEGNFTDESVMNVKESDAEPVKTKNINAKSRVYDVTFKNTDIGSDGKVSVRFLSDKNKKSAVWRISPKDGKWEKLNCAKRGRYVTAELTGDTNTVCIVEEPAGKTVVTVVLCSVFGALVIAAVIVIIIKKKRRKKA